MSKKKTDDDLDDLFDDDEGTTAKEPTEIPPEMAIAGDMVEVTWGQESFWPTRSHGWTVGPFVYRTKILPGEDVMTAFKRAWKNIDKVAENVFESKRKAFLERVKKSQEGHG